jgi:hypothetical protein
MPRKGRPRLISDKACGTKLFVDDLREVIKLAQVERRGTVSDTIRDLVHEALANRRLQTMRRDAAETSSRGGNHAAVSGDFSPLESTLKEMKETLKKLALEGHQNGGSANGDLGRISALLTEIIGFTMTAEMKTHLLLQNFLLSRGLGEEAVKKLIAEHEAKSRKNTEQIVTSLLQSRA